MIRPSRGGRIRVLVVDDAPLACRLITDVLNADPELSVVATAHNGFEAVRKVAVLRPDLVTMDVQMPLLDGFGAVQEIMRRTPVPILVLAERPLCKGGLVGRMLAAGALEVMGKPEGGTRELRGREYAVLRERVKALSRVGGLHRWRYPAVPSPHLGALPQRRAEVVAIVASTGGPAALLALLAHLPASYGVPILVVQHIAQGFVMDLAHWLDESTPLAVRVAQEGDSLAPGHVLLAPDDHHLEVSAAGARLTRRPPELSLRPSGNRLLRSVAKTFGMGAVGVVLTGMGEDGADGLATLRAAGGTGLVQDETTSSIFGMPRAAIEAGGADEVLPLLDIAARLRSLVPTRRRG